jgi:hypothetical protein
MQSASNASAQQRRIGLVLILATGILHLLEAPEYYGEVKYIGGLFVACFLGSVIAAVGIWKQRPWGWWAGIAIAGGSLLAYVASRTVGLPSFREASWSQALEPMGVASMLIEAAFVVLAATLLNATQRDFSLPVSTSS